MNIEKEPERKQLGTLINTHLWKQLKILALEQGTTGGALLEQAMQEFIENHKQGSSVNPHCGRRGSMTFKAQQKTPTKRHRD